MMRISSALLILALTPAILQEAAAAQKPPVVTVNGVAIDRWELDREVQNLLPQTSFHRRLEGERRAQFERLAADALVMKELKRQWAVNEGLPVDNSAVDRDLSAIRERFPDEAAFRRALLENDISEAELRAVIERDYLAEVVDERVLTAVAEPTTAEVEQYFSANRSEYVTPESRHVIHLLVYVSPSASASVWENAGEEASEIAASARAGTSDLLKEVAHRRSEIPPRYRDQTGDLGMIHRNALQADVDEVVFSAMPGEIIGPVRTIYGFSVLRVLAVDPPRQIELEQVRDAVTQRLRTDRRETALAEFEGRLQTAATVEWGSVSAER